MRGLAGRVYLVTGATGGLGQPLSRALAAEGATVALHGRVVRKLEALYDAIVGDGAAEPAILPLDYMRASPDDFAAIADAIDREFGRLDGIVHCAAVLPRLAPIEHHSSDDWSAALRVNLSAPALLTRALLPAMIKAPTSTVIFTLDSRGHAPAAYWGSYAAAKAGLEALVQVLNDEWANRPELRVFGVIPGPIDSPMRQRAYPGDAAGSLPPPSALVPIYVDLLLRREAVGPVVDAGAMIAGDTTAG